MVETHTDSVFDLTHYKPINQKKSQKTKKSIRNKQTTTDDFIDVKMDFILDENIRSLGSRPRTKSVVKYINSRSSSPRLMSNIIILLVDQWIANLSFVMKSQNYLRTQANCRQINRLLNLFLQCSRISNTNFPTKTPELRKRKRVSSLIAHCQFKFDHLTLIETTSCKSSAPKLLLYVKKDSFPNIQNKTETKVKVPKLIHSQEARNLRAAQSSWAMTLFLWKF